MTCEDESRCLAICLRLDISVHKAKNTTEKYDIRCPRVKTNFVFIFVSLTEMQVINEYITLY